MWLREQKLKAGISFSAAVTQLLDYLKETQLSDDGPGGNELKNRMQEARSALYLPCASDTVDLANALARRVRSTRPTDGRDDRKAEHQETLDLLRRFTQCPRCGGLREGVERKAPLFRSGGRGAPSR